MRNAPHIDLRVVAVVILAMVALLLRAWLSTASATMQASNLCPDHHYFSQNLVLICTTDGFYKADNAGWKQLHPLENYELSVSLNEALYLYNVDTGGTQLSLDGGEIWGQSGYYTETLGFQNSLSASPISSTVFIVDNPWNGIYKSTDFGATWRRVYSESGLFKTWITFSPNFAEDGIAFVDFKNETGTKGVWRTENWGETWQHIDEQWLPSTVRTEYTLAISPQFEQDQTVFAVSSFGFFKSVDQGETWSELLYGFSQQTMGVSPNYSQDQTLLAGNLDYQGLYLSQDGGQSWEKIDFPDYPRHIGIRLVGAFHPWPAPVPQASPGSYRVYLPSVQVSQPEQLEFWVVTNGKYGDPSHYLYRSRDLGATWERIPVFEVTQRLFLPLIAHTAASK